MTCARDATATQLTCAGCGTPICPRCLVRTPVGLKCPACTGGAGAGGSRRGARWAGAAAVAALAVAAWVGLGGLGTRPPPDPVVDTSDVDAATRSTIARVGEEVSAGPFTFTVTRTECVGREVGSGPEARVAQGRFCLVHLRVRNQGDRPVNYGGSFQVVTDSSARRYNPGVAESGPPPPPLALGGGVKEIVNTRLNPGAELEGALVFDLPTDTRPAEFEFHHSPRSLGVKVRLDTLGS